MDNKKAPHCGAEGIGAGQPQKCRSSRKVQVMRGGRRDVKKPREELRFESCILLFKGCSVGNPVPFYILFVTGLLEACSHLQYGTAQP